jgi:hypothetical protein
MMEVNPIDETVISIEIPTGAEVGDELSFETNGETFTIPIPPGSEPGDILQVILSGVSKRVKVTTITGNEIMLKESDPSISVGLEKPNSADGTYRCVWPAARFLVDFFHQSAEFRHLIENSRIRSVLELGAGSGVVGLALADLILHFNAFEDPFQVVLTDLEDAMEMIRTNVELNRHNFQDRVHFSTIPLAWHSVPISRTCCTIDFLLGSDLLYNCSNIPHLVTTIRRLSSRKTNIVFAVRWRKPSEERSFFLMLSDVVEWKLVYGACPLDFRSYGNPACEESNIWFSQTMIAIQGKPVSLSRIVTYDNDATERMTDLEYEQFERIQSQVYLGTFVNINKEESHYDQKCKRPKFVDT